MALFCDGIARVWLASFSGSVLVSDMYKDATPSPYAIDLEGVSRVASTRARAARNQLWGN